MVNIFINTVLLFCCCFLLFDCVLLFLYALILLENRYILIVCIRTKIILSFKYDN